MLAIRILQVTIVLGCLAAATTGMAFYVSYDYYTYAKASDGIPVRGDAILTGEVYCDGNYSKTGSYGNYGTARYCADLSSGSVSAWAQAHGVEYLPDHFVSATGRVEMIQWVDRLTFTVPAGYYPSGVAVDLQGHATGTITSDVGAGAEASLWVSLGQEVYQTGSLEVGVEEEGTIVVNDPINLVQELVPPGTTLVAATEYEREVRAYIHRGWTWAPAINLGQGYVIGDGTINFNDGIRIAEVGTPPGVTWTSESGVFLDTASAVPNPVAGLRLEQNHPNPFNPATMITFYLEKDQPTRLQVFDLAGHLVATLLDEQRPGTGIHRIPWDGRDEQGRTVAAGVFIYRLENEELSVTKRMTLIK